VIATGYKGSIPNRPALRSETASDAAGKEDLMKKFNAVIEAVSCMNKCETTGEALEIILGMADHIDYFDWRVEDLDEIAEKLIKYNLIDRELLQFKMRLQN
jgi:hypothetical protein